MLSYTWILQVVSLLEELFRAKVEGATWDIRHVNWVGKIRFARGQPMQDAKEKKKKKKGSRSKRDNPNFMMSIQDSLNSDDTMRTTTSSLGSAGSKVPVNL